MEVTAFLHAAILVTDLEQAQHFYGSVLGLQQVDRDLKFPGLWYQIGPFQIHLITAATVPSDRVNQEKWGRNRHLAFAISDLESMKAQLQEQGYPYQSSASGRAALFVSDPDDNLIELSQTPLESAVGHHADTPQG